jgi:hypothetical protein
LALISVVVSVIALILMLSANGPAAYIAAYCGYSLIVSSWSGAYAALAQDLVLPRMRGAASAALSLLSIVIGAGLGPYWAGKISTLTGSLATGMLSILVMAPVSVVILLMVAGRLRRETPAGRIARAEAAGEPVSRALA